MFRILFKVIFIIVEKVLAEVALLSAFISVSWEGGLYERVLGGLISLYRTLHGFGAAYARNDVFTDVWARFTKEFSAALETAAKNLENEPNTVLGAFILTFASYKLAAWMLKLIRKNLLRSRPKVMKPKVRGRKGPAYDQLYEPPNMSPSTSAYLDHKKTEEDKTY